MSKTCKFTRIPQLPTNAISNNAIMILLSLMSWLKTIALYLLTHVTQPKTSINMFFLVVKIHDNSDYIWLKMESSFTQYQQLDHYQRYNFVLGNIVKHHFSHFLRNQQNIVSLKVNLLLNYQPNQQNLYKTRKWKVYTWITLKTCPR
jgi:hypothetical protein